MAKYIDLDKKEMGGLIEHFGSPMISQGIQQTTSTFDLGGVVQHFSSPTGNPVSTFGNPMASTFAKGGVIDNSIITGFLEKYKHKKTFAGGGQFSSDEPAIYVADLAAYNDGKLEGFWLTLSDYDSGAEVKEKIAEFLEMQSKKSGELREEVAIHDYQNFPSSMYSEYMDEADFDKIIEAYKAKDKFDVPFEVLLDFQKDYGIDSLTQANEFYFTQTDAGSDADKQLGEQYVDIVGGLDNVQNKEFYIDFAEYGQDLRLNMDEDEEEIYEDLDDYTLGEQFWNEEVVTEQKIQDYFDFEGLGNDLSINDFTCYTFENKCYWFHNRTYAKGGNISKKSGFDTYHNTLGETLDEVADFARRNGYTLGEYGREVEHISYGTTWRTYAPCFDEAGKEVNNLQVQIYRMDSGRYELNMYFDKKRKKNHDSEYRYDNEPLPFADGGTTASPQELFEKKEVLSKEEYDKVIAYKPEWKSYFFYNDYRKNYLNLNVYSEADNDELQFTRRYADGGEFGGGVLRGGIRYNEGQELEWHDIMSFDIADYGEEGAEEKAYDYLQESIQYWKGELNENDFRVRRSLHGGRDYRGQFVVMRQFPKFADGGNIGNNLELLKNKIRTISKKMEYDGESDYGGYVVYLGGDKIQILNYSNLSPYSAQATNNEVKVSFNAPNRTMVIFSDKVVERFEDNESYEKYGGIKYIYEPLNDKISSEILEKVLPEKYADGGEFGEGGEIGFIPMKLEEKIVLLSRWGGTNARGVIGLLNAMIDSGISDEDLKYTLTQKETRLRRERAIEKKINEIWNRIQPNYNQELKGNMYYSTLHELISRNRIYPNLLKNFKPYRKYQKFADGGQLMPNQYYFYDDNGNTITFRDFKTAHLKAKEIGIQKFRDNLGGEHFVQYADGGGVNGITPALNKKVNKRAEEIYKIENGKTKSDYDKAFDKAILEFGYSPSLYHKVMREIGSEFDDMGEYADGGVTKNLQRIVRRGKKYSKLAMQKAKPTAKKIVKRAKIGFKALADKVAKAYEGKAVAPKYQKEYGKRYSKAEAKEVGNKVAAKVKRMKGL